MSRPPSTIELLLEPIGGSAGPVGGSARFSDLGLALPDRLDHGRIAWIVADQNGLNAAREALLSHHGRGVLSPGVRTIRQAANAVVSADPSRGRPITAMQRLRLIRGVLDAANRGGRLKHFGDADNAAHIAAQLAGTFAEVSRQAPRDEHDSPDWRPAGADRIGMETALLYRAYRAELAKHGLLDAEERIVAATQMLEAGQAGPLAGVTQLVVTGVRSLPPIERSFLVALGRRSAATVVTLPWRAGAPAPVLSPLPDAPPSPWRAVTQTAASLASGFDNVVTRVLDPPKRGRDALPQRVEAWLFRDPREAPAATTRMPGAAAGVDDHGDGADGDANNSVGGRIRIIEAPSVQAEVEAAAAAAKRLLSRGVPAGEIIVATRRVAALAGRVEQAFATVGAPLSVHWQRRLADAPLFRAVALLVALEQGDWRRADLLAVTTLPAFTAFDEPRQLPSVSALRHAGFAGPRAAAEWVVQDLLLPGGRGQWLRQLAGTRGHEGSADGDADRLPNEEPTRAQLARAAGGNAVSLIDRCLADWRSVATPLTWFDRARATLVGLGYHPGEDATATALDHAALEALEAALAGVEQLAEWRGEPAPGLSLGAFAELLADWQGAATVGAPRADEGRVRLLSCEAARSLRPRHLLLVGMNEASFPAPPPTSITSPTAADHHSAEMLLFLELLLSSTEQTTVSYAATDAGGQPLLPSSYVAELQDLIGGPSPAAPPAEPATLAGARCEAVRALNAGDASRLPAVIGGAAPGGPALASALKVSLKRASGDGFGDAEGVLGGSAGEALASRFGPEHLWSPTQLEVYGVCPFRFFLRHAIGVEAAAGFDLRIDYRRRGSLLHDAMARLHGRLQEAGAGLQAIAASDEDEFVAMFRDAVASAAGALRKPVQQAALAEVEQRQTDEWAPTYFEQLRAYAASEDALGGAMRPAHFETRFGKPRDGEPTLPPSRDDPFVLDLGDESILIVGQVDRIDLGVAGGRPVFNIVDYKAAKEVTARVSDLRDGRQLQLYLYTLATQHHLLAGQGAVPWRMGYWEVRGRGFLPPSEKRRGIQPTNVEDDTLAVDEDWEQTGEAVRRRLLEIVRGARRGEFPMHNADEHCGQRCEFRTTCRVGQTRSLHKLPPWRGAEEGAQS